MKIRYAKLDSKCDFHQPNEIPDSERYNREDPCKAVRSLRATFLNWTKAYALNCKNDKESFLRRMEKETHNIANKLRKHMADENCPVSDN